MAVYFLEIVKVCRDHFSAPCVSAKKLNTSFILGSQVVIPKYLYDMQLLNYVCHDT